MARHVADVRAGLEILAGQHWRDPRSVTAVLTDSAPGERLRIAVHGRSARRQDRPGHRRRDPDRWPTDSSDAGHDVVEATPPELRADDRPVADAHDRRCARRRRSCSDLVMGAETMSAARSVRPRLRSRTEDSRHAPDMHAERYGIMRAWAAFHQEYAVLLSPTWAQPAFAHGADIDQEANGVELTTDTIRPVTHVESCSVHPAVVTPAGVVRRPAGRCAGDGRSLHRSPLPHRRCRDRVARRHAHADRPDHGLIA